MAFSFFLRPFQFCQISGRYHPFALRKGDVVLLDAADRRCLLLPHIVRLRVHFRGNKGDSTGQGTTRSLGGSSVARIVYQAVLSALRTGAGSPSEPLFLLSDHSMLDSDVLVHMVQSAATAVGILERHITSHVFRVSGAMAMADAQAEDSCLRWGQWSSSAFLVYLRDTPAAATRIATFLLARL